MSGWRLATIVGFVVVFLGAGGLVILRRCRPERMAKVGESLTALSRRKGPRLVVVFVWAWLGWHFLAR